MTNVQVLSGQTIDAHPAFLLSTTGNKKYLFNVPEMICRISMLNRTKLKRVKHVFVDSMSNAQGIAGFILTNVESGNLELDVVAPDGMAHWIGSCRNFVRRDRLALSVRATAGGLVLQDEALSVYAFPLVAPLSQKRGRSLSADSRSSGRSSSFKRRALSNLGSPRGRGEASTPESDVPSDTVAAETSTEDIIDSLPSACLSEEEFAASLLKQRVLRSDFDPAKIGHPHVAALWRELVLSDMFKGKKVDMTPYLVKNGFGKNIPPSSIPMGLPVASRSRESISYLCVTPPKRGRFLNDKATAEGVPFGPIRSRLVKGERVWVPTNIEPEDKSAGKKKKSKKRTMLTGDPIEGVEGRWIDPEPFMAPTEKGSSFLFVNIPDTSYLSNLDGAIPLATQQQWTSLLGDSPIKTVFYTLGPGVVTSDSFKNFIDSQIAPLGPDIIHRVSAPELREQGDVPTFPSATLLSMRLSKLSENIFPPFYYSYKNEQGTMDIADLKSLFKSDSVADIQAGQFIALDALENEPSPPWIRSLDFKKGSTEEDAELSRLKTDIKDEADLEYCAQLWNEYCAMTSVISNNIKDQEKNMDSDYSDVKVTSLGTGSAVPTKYRNVSSTLLHLPCASGMRYALLDVGEGTASQLFRIFGKDKYEEIIKNLGFIFISHMHQDHHGGLSRLLIERQRILLADDNAEVPFLMILAPPGVRHYLKEQSQVVDIGLDYPMHVYFVDNRRLEPGASFRPEGRIKELYALLNIKSITTAPVKHSCRCHGIAIERLDGFKVVFSGDTMPCESLSQIGKDATLLIHEATMEDDMSEMATAKGHSTFSEAVNMGKRMNARNVLLTHFSARYPKGTPARTSKEDDSKINIALAFDGMTLRMDEFWKSQHFSPALQLLFTRDEPEEDDIPVAAIEDDKIVE